MALCRSDFSIHQLVCQKLNELEWVILLNYPGYLATQVGDKYYKLTYKQVEELYQEIGSKPLLIIGG